MHSRLDTMLTCSSANKLQNGHEVLLSAELKSAFQHITCYVMCDDIGMTPVDSIIINGLIDFYERER